MNRVTENTSVDLSSVPVLSISAGANTISHHPLGAWFWSFYFFHSVKTLEIKANTNVSLGVLRAGACGHAVPGLAQCEEDIYVPT